MTVALRRALRGLPEPGRVPSLPANNRAALHTLLRDFGPYLRPAERKELIEMHARPKLTVRDRLRLSVLARGILDRVKEAQHAV